MKQLLIDGEILAHTTAVEWSDDIDNVANTITFTSDKQIQVGSKFALMDDDNTVMTGIISEYTQNEANRFSYMGYDFGFYLNKNSIVKQLNGIPIKNAFTQLCNDYNIPVGSIPDMTSTVKKIYKNETLADVFRNLLKLHKSKTGEDYYYFTCSDGKFNVRKYEINEQLLGYTGDIYATESINTITAPSISVSMEDLKNRVLVTDESEKITSIVTADDTDSISKYGLLQYVEQIDTDNTNRFETVAKNKLQELNKLKTTIDLTMLGDFNMHKGVVMPITNERLSLDGDYLITASRHVIESSKETVKINVVRYDRDNLNV